MGWFSGSSVVSTSHSHHSSHHRKRSRSPARSEFFRPRSRTSTRARSRHGYMSRIYSQLRRWVREFVYYMRKHPMKMFMLVIMPLITGGALTGVLKKFGVRLPAGMGSSRGGFGDSFSSRGSGIETILGGGGIGSLLKLVQMFT